MLGQPQFLNALAPVANRGFEQRYRATIPGVDVYQLINTAVWYALARLAPGDNTVYNGVDGGQCYYIRCGTIWVQLFVLRLSSHAAILQVFPMLPTDPIEGILWLQANHRETSQALAHVFGYCQQHIRKFLHDAAEAENYNPPPPDTSDWAEIIDWADTYYSRLEDKEIESRFGIPAKTLRNNRSRLGKPKRKMLK